MRTETSAQMPQADLAALRTPLDAFQREARGFKRVLNGVWWKVKPSLEASYV